MLHLKLTTLTSRDEVKPIQLYPEAVIFFRAYNNTETLPTAMTKEKKLSKFNNIKGFYYFAPILDAKLDLTLFHNHLTLHLPCGVIQKDYVKTGVNVQSC